MLVKIAYELVLISCFDKQSHYISLLYKVNLLTNFLSPWDFILWHIVTILVVKFCINNLVFARIFIDSSNKLLTVK